LKKSFTLIGIAPNSAGNDFYLETFDFKAFATPALKSLLKLCTLRQNPGKWRSHSPIHFVLQRRRYGEGRPDFSCATRSGLIYVN
jgi:hypothetical protein